MQTKKIETFVGGRQMTQSTCRQRRSCEVARMLTEPSIGYDIITKAYGGTITMDSEEGVFTEFVVGLSCRTS